MNYLLSGIVLFAAVAVLYILFAVSPDDQKRLKYTAVFGIIVLICLYCLTNKILGVVCLVLLAAGLIRCRSAEDASAAPPLETASVVSPLKATPDILPLKPTSSDLSKKYERTSKEYEKLCKLLSANNSVANTESSKNKISNYAKQANELYSGLLATNKREYELVKEREKLNNDSLPEATKLRKYYESYDKVAAERVDKRISIIKNKIEEFDRFIKNAQEKIERTANTFAELSLVIQTGDNDNAVIDQLINLSSSVQASLKTVDDLLNLDSDV